MPKKPNFGKYANFNDVPNFSDQWIYSTKSYTLSPGRMQWANLPYGNAARTPAPGVTNKQYVGTD